MDDNKYINSRSRYDRLSIFIWSGVGLSVLYILLFFIFISLWGRFYYYYFIEVEINV